MQNITHLTSILLLLLHAEIKQKLRLWTWRRACI